MASAFIIFQILFTGLVGFSFVYGFSWPQNEVPLFLSYIFCLIFCLYLCFNSVNLKSTLSSLRQKLSVVWLLPPAIVLLIAYFCSMDFIPIWDSVWYANCLESATQPHLNLAQLGCIQYDSFSYLSMLALLFKVFHYDFKILYLYNLLMSYALLSVLYLIFLEYKVDKKFAALGAGLLSISPLFIVTGLNINPDFALVVYWFIAYYFLTVKKFEFACLLGLLLSFTKMTGAIHYGLLVLIFLALDTYKNKRVAWSLAALLYIPTVVYLSMESLYIVLKIRSHLPSHLDFNYVLKNAFNLDPFRRRNIELMFGVSLLNFNWVYWPTILFGLYSFIKKRQSSNLNIFLAISFLGSLFIVSRILPFYNPRYFLLPHLLWGFMGLLTIYTLLKNLRLKFALNIVLYSLLVVSSFRTIDPVSKAIFGSFFWGAHELLSPGKSMDNAPVPGRDQIVYNLQVLNVHRLLDIFYQKYQISDKDLLVTSPQSNPYHLAYIDKKTYGRVAVKQNAFLPNRIAYFEIPDNDLGRQFYLLNEPYFVQDLPLIPKQYTLSFTDQISLHGYTLEVQKYTLDTP